MVARSRDGLFALKCFTVMTNVGSAIVDVQADALLVRKAQGKSQKTASVCQSLGWMMHAFGAILAFIVGGRVLKEWGFQSVVIMLMCVSTMPLFLAFPLIEERVPFRGAANIVTNMKKRM
jgi:MFS-type transporter involved in bile tolerance (Atg22 family)